MWGPQGPKVKRTKRNGQTPYICEQCGFAYDQREWVEKCQKWSEEHHSCNLEIAQHAVQS